MNYFPMQHFNWKSAFINGNLITKVAEVAVGKLSVQYSDQVYVMFSLPNLHKW